MSTSNACHPGSIKLESHYSRGSKTFCSFFRSAFSSFFWVMMIAPDHPRIFFLTFTSNYAAVTVQIFFLPAMTKMKIFSNFLSSTVNSWIRFKFGVLNESVSLVFWRSAHMLLLRWGARVNNRGYALHPRKRAGPPVHNPEKSMQIRFTVKLNASLWIWQNVTLGTPEDKWSTMIRLMSSKKSSLASRPT